MAPADSLAWRVSTRSSNGENCVEVALGADDVIIRHSKHPAAGTIAFSHLEWRAFLHEARAGRASGNRGATITKSGTDTLVRSLTTDVELRFDEGEWSAFLAGAADGEFDVTRERAIT